MRISRNRLLVAVAVMVVGAFAGTLFLGGGRLQSVLRFGGSSAAAPAMAPAAPGQDPTGKSTELRSGSGVGSGSGSGSSDAGVALYDASRPDLLVIKTGNLDLQVAKLDAAIAMAGSRIAALGGYASGSDRSGDGDAARASVTYRIPSAAWDQALESLRAIAVKVVAEHSQTEDVTTQVVDLSARIANLQVTEKALQDIMAKADKIADVLDVQTQLTTIRGQIEQATAERKHLQDSASFSTLTVGFGLTPDPVVTAQQKFDPKGEVDRATGSLVEVLQAAATAGIWFAIVWLPILLVLGAGAGLVTFGWRRVARPRVHSAA